MKNGYSFNREKGVVLTQMSQSEKNGSTCSGIEWLYLSGACRPARKKTTIIPQVKYNLW